MLSQRQLFLNHLAPTSPTPLELEVQRAQGVFLYGVDGRRYIDLVSGVSVSNLGHCHPAIVDAVCQQAQRYMHLMVYGEYIQSPQVALARRLAELLPPQLSCTYLVNSGSEAVEGAIKLAKRATGLHKVIAFRNAYHGSTHGALSLMGHEPSKRAFRPLVPGVTHIDFNSPNQLQLIDKGTACVVIEPVQAEAGVIVPQTGFLQELRERCTQQGCLLVLDEIQTGMGRTGMLFAFERYGIVPDILLLAKALGGGMPIGAFVASKELMRCLSYSPTLGHITTFGGHPVSCAAALASLGIITGQDVIGGVHGKEQLFRELLQEHPSVRTIRSSGLLMALEMESFDRVQRVQRLALDKGAVTDWFLFCNTALRIAPPLTITEEEIREACGIILSALDHC